MPKNTKNKKNKSKRSSSSPSSSGGSSLLNTLVYLTALVVVAGVAWKWFLTPPPTNEVHVYRTLDNIWSKKEVDALVSMVEDYKVLRSSAADQTSSIEHIGEAVPIGENGMNVTVTVAASLSFSPSPLSP
jgi:hypothetical protein